MRQTKIEEIDDELVIKLSVGKEEVEIGEELQLLDLPSSKYRIKRREE